MRLVCLVAFKNSGKSTFFEFLRDYYDAKELMLSDHLKNTCAKVLNLDRKYFDDDKLKEARFAEKIKLSRNNILQIYKEFDLEPNPKLVSQFEDALLYSPRHITQFVGTDILRATRESIHIEAAMKHSSQNGLMVTMDLRFQNEYEYFRKNTNAVFVFIQRNKATPLDLESLHQSERAIPNIGKHCDFVIQNDGTKLEFLRKVLAFAEVLPNFQRISG